MNGLECSASSNSAPASPPSELFTNNVDNFSKGNKDREIRGPSAPVGPVIHFSMTY